MIVCIECNKLDKYTLITKTNAKLKYFLTEDDLDDSNLPNYEGKSGYGPGTYFTIYDIKNKLCEKNNANIDQFDNVLAKLLSDKKKRKEDRIVKSNAKIQLQRTKRKEILVNALQKAGLEFRNDSELCSKYINDNFTTKQSDDIVDKIVKRMCQMKYLYDYCHMAECKNIVYDEYMDMRNNDEYSYFEYYAHGSISDEAEILALQKYSNSVYPQIFPWQI